MSEDYDHKFLPDQTVDGVAYRTIENTAKSTAKVMWPRIVTLSDKKDCLPRFNYYYDKENKLRRTLSSSDITKFDGHLVPATTIMRPEDDKTKMTTIKYKSMNFSPKFKDNQFSQKNLTDG